MPRAGRCTPRRRFCWDGPIIGSARRVRKVYFALQGGFQGESADSELDVEIVVAATLITPQASLPDVLEATIVGRLLATSEPPLALLDRGSLGVLLGRVNVLPPLSRGKNVSFDTRFKLESLAVERCLVVELRNQVA